MDTLSANERSALMAKVRNRNTEPEIRVRRAAHSIGLRFRLHRRDLPGSPDLVFPKHRVTIFVHGCFWHQHPGCKRASVPKSRTDFWIAKLEQNRARDKAAIAALKILGWRPIVIWECQTRRETELRRLLMKIFGLRSASCEATRPV